MGIVNFQLKECETDYKPLNCMAVAQLIKDFNKAVSEEPHRRESLLDYLELVHLLSKGDKAIYEKEYGTQWAREAKEANVRILEENGRIKNLKVCTP